MKDVTEIRKAKIFIAWSRETKQAAKIVQQRLDEEKLEPWLSDQIEWGAQFRNKIRETILSSHLVIAVFPEDPSRWQIAEAGLAYFEQKLLTVVVGGSDDAIDVVDPFGELQAYKLDPGDIERGHGASLDELVALARNKLGVPREGDWFYRLSRSVNNLFFLGVPLIGAALMVSMMIAGLTHLKPDEHGLEQLKAGHAVFGAIVYGGGIFVALLFALAGTSTSFSERQFGFRTGRRLFYVWLIVALAQLAIGLALLYVSPHSYHAPWIFISLISYIASLCFWLFAFDRYRTSNDIDRGGRPLRAWTAQSFWGNLFFSIGLLMLTLVVVLMSLQETTLLNSLFTP